MEQEEKISYEQMVEAYNYVISYLKFIGLNPATDYPIEESELEGWSEDAKKAWMVVKLFDDQNEGKDL